MITGIRDVDGAGHNVYWGITARWGQTHRDFEHEQYSVGTQTHHFLRDKSQTQMQAYNAAINQFETYAKSQRSALMSGDQDAAYSAAFGAGHLIEDSFAHTTRDGGNGAMTHIQCFTCKHFGGGYDHHHPELRVYGQEGNMIVDEGYSSEGQASVDAEADYLKLMQGAKNMSNSDFASAVSAFEKKWFPQNLPSDK